MNRRKFLSVASAALGSAALVSSSGAALASAFGEDVIAQLTRQGFGNITTETTWLGRERILAERADGTREIILNPRTGEILRDTWLAKSGAAGHAKPIVDDVEDHSGSGSDDGSDGGGSDSGGSDGGGSDGGGSDGGGSDSGGSDSGGSDGGSDDSGDDSGGGSDDNSGSGSGSGGGGKDNGGKDDGGKDD